MKKYLNWIAKFYPSYDKCKDRCYEAVSSMITAFPELLVQTGRANGIFHCWCKTTDGEIVDPTDKQFTKPIRYDFIADRFLDKDEIETSTGIVFLKEHKND